MNNEALFARESGGADRENDEERKRQKFAEELERVARRKRENFKRQEPVWREHIEADRECAACWLPIPAASHALAVEWIRWSADGRPAAVETDYHHDVPCGEKVTGRKSPYRAIEQKRHPLLKHLKDDDVIGVH